MRKRRKCYTWAPQATDMFHLRHPYAARCLTLVNSGIRGRIKRDAAEYNAPILTSKSLNISPDALKEISLQPCLICGGCVTVWFCRCIRMTDGRYVEGRLLVHSIFIILNFCRKQDACVSTYHERLAHIHRSSRLLCQCS